jgi:hypothetical protein
MTHGPIPWLRCALGAGLLAVSVAAHGAARAADATFVLRIENNRVAPNMRLIRVKQGDAVKLQWSTDRTVIVHLHGYDIEKKVVAGAVTELEFTARATGRFPVHLHGGGAGSAGHGHESALVTIEVYPR